MATLIADRFLLHGTATRHRTSIVAIDLAIGQSCSVCSLAPPARQRAADLGRRVRARLRRGTAGRFRLHRDGAPVRSALHGSASRRLAHTPASESLLEWLERPHPSSSRVLCVRRTSRRARSSPARIRAMRCRASRARHALERHPGRCSTKRSVVLLDSRGAPVERRARACCGFAQSNVARCLRHRAARAAKRRQIAAAAESRAAYDGLASPKRHGRAAAADAGCRVAQLMAEAERMLQRGRHSAAERALRGAGGSGRAQRRFGFEPAMPDWRSAGCCSLAAARPTRRPRSEMRTIVFSRGTRPPGSRRDDSSRPRADRSGGRWSKPSRRVVRRMQRRPRFGVRNPRLSAAIALARTLLWQRRQTTRRSILEAVRPGRRCRSAARDTGVSSPGSTSPAVRFPRHARPSHMRARVACDGSPVLESLVRLCEASDSGASRRSRCPSPSRGGRTGRGTFGAPAAAGDQVEAGARGRACPAAQRRRRRTRVIEISRHASATGPFHRC